MPGSQAQTGAITIVPTPWEGQEFFTDPVTGQSIPTSFLLQVGMWYLNQTTGVGGVDGESGTGFSFDLGDGNKLWQNLYEYADIMMPPTETTWGMARMFHMYNGYPYYVDIPMPPLSLGELPFLVVYPASATISVGATQQFDALYFYNGQESKVTKSSNWSDNNNSVASIGTNTGLTTGDSAGSTNITATYTPLNGSVLTGTAALTVQGQQQQQNGGYNATLSFQAVNQPEIKDYHGPGDRRNVPSESEYSHVDGYRYGHSERAAA